MPTSHPLRVLIVEDSADDAELMVLRLEEEGFRPDWRRVQTEVEYLAALATAPDLILADWSLPQFSGMAALRLMRERELDIPFIIVSGSIGEEAAVDAMRHGAYDYVLKDRPARLGPAVRRALADREAREERRRAQEALRASEARYRALIEATTDMIFVKDHDLRYLIANRALAAFLGREVADIIGKTDAELLDAQTAEAVRRCDLQALQSAAAVILEETAGDRTYQLIRFPIPLTDDEIGVGGIVRDITGRKRVEAQLRQANVFLDSIIENIPDMVFMKDARDLRFVRFNRAGEELLGLSRDVLLGKNDYDLFPAEQADFFTRTDREVLRGKAIVDIPEEPIQTRTKGLRFLHTKKVPLLNAQGEPEYLLGISEDITERKAAEQKLADLVRFQTELLETPAIWIDTLDEEGNITFWNRGAERISGYLRQEVLGHRRVWEWLYPDAEERHRIFARAMAATRRGEPMEDVETVIRRKDGEQRVIAWYSTSITDGAGQLRGRIVMGADITARKQAEEKLQQTLAELARTNEELERFAYIASHDLQEPLRMVASFVQLLAERYQGQLDSDADEFIAFAVDGARRMQRLINDLLEYSRVSTRGQPLRPTDAEAVLADVLWNLNIAIEEAGATVTHDPLPTVLADPTQLMQLLQNLIGNAIKFRSERPPVIHISAKREEGQGAREAKDPVLAVPASSFYVFSVHDNGIGIAPEYHERIFGVFQRLHTRQEYPGTGIGLAICRRVVERHGGRIWVESQPGQGATFYFTLPAALVGS